MRRAASPRPARLPGLGGLDAHLADAIRLNRARRAGYVERGGLRAALLSRALVGAERALRPAARWLDRRAAPFWADGVLILAAELSDMAAAPPADRPVSQGEKRRTVCEESPSWTGGDRGGRWAGGAATRERPPFSDGRGGLSVRRARSGPPPRLPAPLLSRRGTTLLGRGPTPPREPLDLRPARRHLRAGRFQACAVEIAAVLGAPGGAAPLTRHVLESAGLMAVRGAAYAEATGGATAALTRDLVRGHLALAPVARLLDRMAAPLWARGVGLFANDLPPIPFEAEMDAAPPRPTPAYA